jgi:predicted transcriptional regulator
MKSPLEQLFGSMARVKILRLFLNFDADESRFYVREISRKLKLQLNSVRRELAGLEAIGFVSGGTMEQKRKFYRLNKEFPLYKELKSLFSKAELFLENKFIDEIKKLGKINLIILTGSFVGQSEMATDMLIVGRVSKKILAKKIKEFEQEFGKEVNYTLFSPQEYKYRRDVTDKFLYGILENKKIVAFDNWER